MIMNPVRAWRNHRVACEIAAAAIDFAAIAYDGMTTGENL